MSHDESNKKEYCQAIANRQEGVVFRWNENKWSQSKDPVWKSSVEYRFVPYKRLEGFFRKGVDELVKDRDFIPTAPPREGPTQAQRLIYTLLMQGGRLIQMVERMKAVSGDQNLDYLITMVGSGKNWTWVPQWAEDHYKALREGRLTKPNGEYWPSHACGIFNWEHTRVVERELAEFKDDVLRFDRPGKITLIDENGKDYEVTVGDGLTVTRQWTTSEGESRTARIYF